MLKLTKIFGFILVLMVGSIFSRYGDLFADSVRLHPKNLKLMKMHPERGRIKTWLDVPRVSAEEAIFLYKSGRALMVRIGVTSPTLMGGIKLGEVHAHNINIKKVQKLANKRIIIAY